MNNNIGCFVSEAFIWKYQIRVNYKSDNVDKIRHIVFVYKNGDHQGMNGPVRILWWISNFKEEMRNVYDEI